MKKIAAFILTLLVYNFTANSQSYLGAHYTTKDAILSNAINPAMGIAGDVKWQVNLLGFNTSVGNNYFFIKGLKGITKDFDKDKYIGENLDGKRKQLNIDLGFMGPAGFIRIKQNNAISFGIKARAVVTFNDVNQDLVNSLYNHFEDILQWLPNFEDERAAGAVNTYHEIYAGYARSFNFSERHSLHVGLNAKMITNIFNAQFTADDINFNKIYTSPTDSFINVGNSKFQLDVSDRIDDGFNYKFGISGFGFDVGLVYEYKLKDSKDHFIMAGASVNDLGYNKYTLGKNSRSFVGNGRNIPAEHLVDAFGTTNNLDEVLDSLGTNTKTSGTRKIKLPTTLNVFVDVRVVKMFYINTNIQLNPYTFKKGTAVANLPMDITVTPRFEHRIVSVYVPINWNQYSGFNMGAGLRVGQFTLGSSSIITSFAKKKFSGVDFYMNIGFGKIDKSKNKKKTEAPVPEENPGS